MKGVVIISGGCDSTTLTYDLKNQGYELKALSFLYGQKHKKELEFAKKTCEKLKIEHCIIDLKVLKLLLSNSALTGNIKMPYGHYEDPSMKLTVVPNRNAIMLAIAVGYAENEGYNKVFYGAHKGDYSQYPDCRPEFIEALSKAEQLGTYNKVEIVAPYQNLLKREIILEGLKIGIDYEKECWSCYEGLDFPCGRCGSCNERLESEKWAVEQIRNQQIDNQKLSL